MTGEQMRVVLLQVVRERAGKHTLQTGSVINEAAKRLGIGNNQAQEQALLTFWHDLFRTGYLAWGYDLANYDPPFCHITDQGRKFLENLSRDPANPGGYLAYLSMKVSLNPVSESYMREALATYNSGNHKAAAVMVGAAAEAAALGLRDALAAKLDHLGHAKPQQLKNWRIKTVLDALYNFYLGRKKEMPRELFDSFQAYWPAFSQQIRAARNDAGHPTSIEPVTSDTVHAALLIFPELAALSSALEKWTSSKLK